MSANLWEPFEPNTWSVVASTAGVCATEADVKAGRAVFYLKGGGAPYSMALPHCAVWSNPDEEKPIPGVIIQAEHGDGQILVGFRPFKGGNALGLLPEFRLLNGPAEFAQ